MSERLHDGHATPGDNIVPRRRSGHGRISEASDARYGPRIVHDAVHHGHARHLRLLCEQMLRHASADVVARNHDWVLVPSAWRKRISQAERCSTEASLTVSSPPERPKPGNRPPPRG